MFSRIKNGIMDKWKCFIKGIFYPVSMKILVEGFSTSLLGHSKQTAPMVNMVYGFGR